MVVLLPFLLVM